MKIIFLHPLIDTARQWWSSLSINEMRTMAAKHQAPFDHHRVYQVDSMLVDTYEKEHGLEPIEGRYY